MDLIADEPEATHRRGILDRRQCLGWLLTSESQQGGNYNDASHRQREADARPAFTDTASRVWRQYRLSFLMAVVIPVHESLSWEGLHADRISPIGTDSESVN
jgi:hypothetical protein